MSDKYINATTQYGDLHGNDSIDDMVPGGED